MNTCLFSVLNLPISLGLLSARLSGARSGLFDSDSEEGSEGNEGHLPLITGRITERALGIDGRR